MIHVEAVGTVPELVWEVKLQEDKDEPLNWRFYQAPTAMDAAHQFGEEYDGIHLGSLMHQAITVQVRPTAGPILSLATFNVWNVEEELPF